ncbi:hypothetical protein FB45DRAFT_1017606 [Roridomyces roridus]|uniref:C2 domain-containing protein n=1 Tax=Roridomyces roridus TaxID=1738132 RepID=A0AAD7CIY6_9AGAR|nr:hypothetical protein FB45DRAFT_1017606 [Roridomyces roridus]
MARPEKRLTSTRGELSKYDPSWLSQTFYFLVTNPTEEVQLVLHDHRGRPSVLGVGTFDLSLVTGSDAKSDSDSGIALNTYLSILKGKQRRGDLLCSFIYIPISTTLPEEKSNVGIVHIFLSGVDNLLPSNRISAVAAVRLAWDLPPIYTTPRVALSNGSGNWGTTHEFLCFDKTACVIYIDVLNYDCHDESIGHVHIFLVDLLEATVRSWPLSGTTAGRLTVSAQWRALDLG